MELSEFELIPVRIGCCPSMYVRHGEWGNEWISGVGEAGEAGEMSLSHGEYHLATVPGSLWCWSNAKSIQ